MLTILSRPTPSTSVTRRVFTSSVVAQVLALVLEATPAAIAARGWCRSDPLLEFDGTLAYVVYSAPPGIRKATTGSIEIVVSIPRGVAAKLIAPGPGFGHGESVQFISTSEMEKTNSGVQAQVAVRIPAGDELPVRLECARRTHADRNSPAVAEGTTNRWLSLTHTF
jgi:hypothetical protein